MTILTFAGMNILKETKQTKKSKKEKKSEKNHRKSYIQI
jgi:hypothetical protein